MTSTRNRLRLFAVLLAISALQTLSRAAPAQDIPPKEGVFVRLESGEWERVYKAVLDDKKMKGMDRFLRTEGQIPMGVTLTFGGSNSPLQLHNHRPEFYIKGPKPGDDTVIVQLVTRKDSREIQTSSLNIQPTNREGFRIADIHRITASPAAGGFTRIAPQDELKAGEYLLVFGTADSSYDFGIQPR